VWELESSQAAKLDDESGEMTEKMTCHVWNELGRKENDLNEVDGKTHEVDSNDNVMHMERSTVIL